MKAPALSSIEILESRIAPAGLVTVAYDAATGELTLTGDTLGNVVRITEAGPGQHRIDGILTDVGTLGTTFFELGKLTKITFFGGDQSDRIELANLRGLTGLELFGEAGSDLYLLENVTVKGPLGIHGGAGGDFADFSGVLTSVTGTVTVDSALGAADSIGVTFGALTTVVGGPVLFTGGGGSDSLRTEGSGSATFSKGIDFTAGASTSSVNFFNVGALTVGKLPTGESIAYTGGDDSNGLTFNGGNVTLASGIRMAGDVGTDSIGFGAAAAVVKIGKLATGQSILFDGGVDDDGITIDGTSIALAGGIEMAGGDGIAQVLIGGSGSAVKLGKLASGQSILVTGGVNDDGITLNGSSLTLAGGVELQGGASGLNEISLASTGSRVTVGKMASGASVLLAGGSGQDRVSLEGVALTLAGGIDVSGGEGSNSVSVTSSSNVVKIGKLTGGQSLRYTGGAATDAIEIAGVSVALAGAVEVNAGSGSNSLDIDGEQARTTIGKYAEGASILFNGGTGTDNVTVAGFQVTLAGGIDVDLGDGSNSVDLESPNGVVKVGKLSGSQSIRFDGGSGGDSISSDAASTVLAGGIELEGEGGNNRVAFDSGGKVNVGRFGTGTSLLFTGTGNADNEVDFGGTSVLAGSLEVTGGTGTEDIDLDGTVKIGKNADGISVSLLGGDGNDALDFADDISLAGSVFFDAGAGNDDLDFDSVDTLTIGGSVEMIGGTGGDDFDLVSYRLSVAGGIIFTGGDDQDTFNLQADGRIAGDVTVDLGLSGAGGQFVELTSRTRITGGLSLLGALTVDADATNTTTDLLTLTNVSVAKLIDLELGGGASTVTIDNLFASDQLRIDTRGGVDLIAIERGNFFGNSSIAKLATILAGDGDDQILIGGAPDAVVGFPDSTRVNFRGGLTLDGGNGANDNRNDIAGQNTFATGVTPTITNVELSSLV